MLYILGRIPFIVNVWEINCRSFIFFIYYGVLSKIFSSFIGHDLGQRVKIIQKRNRWVDLKILSWKVSFCGFKESQERILQLDHFCSHWSIKLPMKFFAPIMRYNGVMTFFLGAVIFSSPLTVSMCTVCQWVVNKIVTHPVTANHATPILQKGKPTRNWQRQRKVNCVSDQILLAIARLLLLPLHIRGCCCFCYLQAVVH